MTDPERTVRSLREDLAQVARAAHPSEPTTIRVSRRVRLAHGGDVVGWLRCVFQVALSRGAPARGTLIFEWPSSVSSHASVARLGDWCERGRSDGIRACGTVVVACRDVTVDVGGDLVDGTRLVLAFPLSSIPDDVLGLLDLAVRMRVADEIVERLDEACGDDGAARAGRSDAIGAEEQARIDTIRPNAVYDAEVHPHVPINAEVTTSAGDTFRLVGRRGRGAGASTRRVWVKVPHGRPAVTLPGPRRPERPDRTSKADHGDRAAASGSPRAG